MNELCVSVGARSLPSGTMKTRGGSTLRADRTAPPAQSAGDRGTLPRLMQRAARRAVHEEGGTRDERGSLPTRAAAKRIAGRTATSVHRRFPKRNGPMAQGAAFWGRRSIGSSTIFATVGIALKSIKEQVYDVDVCTGQKAVGMKADAERQRGSWFVDGRPARSYLHPLAALLRDAELEIYLRRPRRFFR
jgi:hypothetical protein